LQDIQNVGEIQVFSSEDREWISEKLISWARSDERIVSAAFVGSSASGGDRWSDLDLTFGISSSTTVADVLSDWTTRVVEELGAVVLFDLPVQRTIYRVFLLPGALQVDLSFSSAEDFGPRGPRFELIFGEANEGQWISAPPQEQAFGLAIHHIVRAHICIERGRLWQAEYWQHQARDLALTLACQWHNLEPRNGRGFDALPDSVHEQFSPCFVGALSVGTLTRALAVTTQILLQNTPAAPKEVEQLREMLQEISLPPEIAQAKTGAAS